MKKSIELRSQLDEKRNALRDLINASDPDSAKIREATKEVRNAETKYTAQLTLEESEKAQAQRASDSQFVDLESRGSIGEIVCATIEGRSATGETAELLKELKLSSNQIPLSLLTERSGSGVEHRAATVAPANAGRTQGEIIGSVFPQSQAEFLNIPMPMVEPSSRSYPVLTTGATASTPAKAGVVSESSGVFAATDMKPKRIQASFLFAREDAATMPGMDESLRLELSDALMSGLDAAIIAAIIAGGTANDLSGSKVADYGIFTDLLHGSVDGAYASSAMDIRCLFGSDTYKLAASAFSNSTTQLAPTAAQRLGDESGGLRVSSNVPGTDTKKQKGILRRGMRMDAVCPLWQGVEIVVDNVTQSQKGQIIVTAVLLHNVAVLRAGGFVIPEFKVVT